MTTNVAVCIENAKEAINDCLNGAPAAERRELLAGALRSLAKAQEALAASSAKPVRARATALSGQRV